MILRKPKFWNKKKSSLSTLLIPFAFLVKIIIHFKKICSFPKKFNIPVICVGNIYIGGTGKTPSTLFIAKKLLQRGKKPAIIKKFYKEHFDEHELIKEYFPDLILDKNRSEGVRRAENNYDAAILDDGFQDYKIKKDLNILCFNNEQLLGNELVIPAGPLRESLNGVKNADIIIINGKQTREFEDKILKINSKLNIFYSSYIPENIENFKNKKLIAIAGIGNPENFFKLLTQYGLIIEKKLVYPDHYNFSKSEVLDLVDEANKKNHQIITTEKDYFRIKKFKIDNINYVKLKYKICDEENFLNKIMSIYD